MIRTKGSYTGQLLYPRAASRQPMITKCDFCWSTEGSSDRLMRSEQCWAVLPASSGGESTARRVGGGGSTPPQGGLLPARMLWEGKAWVFLNALLFPSPRIAKISPNGFRALDLVQVFGWAVMTPCTHPCSSQRLRIFVCQGSCSPHFHHINKTFQVVSMRRMSAPLTWTETLGFISWDVSCNQRWQMLHVPPHYLTSSNEKQ